MEVISPTRQAARPSVRPILSSAAVGTGLIVGGLILAYVAFATPALTMLVPGGRRDAIQTAAGMVVWAIALVAPAGFLLLGTNRLARMLAAISGRVSRRTAAVSVLSGLPMTSSWPVASPWTTGGRSRTSSSVRSGPPWCASSRRRAPCASRTGTGSCGRSAAGSRWRTRCRRTVRDSERVRRWLAHDDADFVVKVYAAVVSRELDVPRTTACAVLRPDQLAAWVAALPPQRSITAGRREQIVDRVREAAG